jgi:hypothetical protein
VVGVEREGPALQHVPKLPDALHIGYQLSVLGQVPPLGGVQRLVEEARGLPGHCCRLLLLESRPHVVHHQGHLCPCLRVGHVGRLAQGGLGLLEGIPAIPGPIHCRLGLGEPFRASIRGQRIAAAPGTNFL